MPRTRGNGEGGVYQRGDGKWVAVLSVGYSAEGKRLRRKRIAATKSEAAAKLRELERDRARQLDPGADRWTVGRWLERWLETEARTTLRPRSFLSTKADVQRHLVPALGRHRLRGLTPTHVREWMAAQLEAGAAPQSVRNRHSTLRRALGIAESYGYVERNVAKLVSPPPARRAEVRPLTVEEVGWVLQAAKGDRLEALWVLAASTGMRQAELLGLTWECVDLAGATVRVERTLQRYDRAFHLDEPKTARSRRTVPVPAPVVEALRHHRDRQTLAERAGQRAREAPHVPGDPAGTLWIGNEWGLVFTDEAGRPIHSRDIRDDFLALLDRADALAREAAERDGAPRPEGERHVRRVRFHDLRHGAATYLVAAGVPMRLVMEQLGHSQMATTSDLYSHVEPAVQREAADRLAAVLFASGE